MRALRRVPLGDLEPLGDDEKETNRLFLDADDDDVGDVFRRLAAGSETEADSETLELCDCNDGGVEVRTGDSLRLCSGDDSGGDDPISSSEATFLLRGLRLNPSISYRCNCSSASRKTCLYNTSMSGIDSLVVSFSSSSFCDCRKEDTMAIIIDLSVCLIRSTNCCC